MSSNAEYRPLYAERRCLVCGYWRGQHTSVWDAGNDSKMLCPIDASWFETTASFVPGPERGAEFNTRAAALGVGEETRDER